MEWHKAIFASFVVLATASGCSSFRQGFSSRSTILEASPASSQVANDVIREAYAYSLSATCSNPEAEAVPCESYASCRRIDEAVICRVSAETSEHKDPDRGASAVACPSYAIDEAKTRGEWYEKFSASPGSRAYWILRTARIMAERGEDVSELKKLFDELLVRFLDY